MSTGLLNVIRREIRRLASRPIYLVGIVAIPVMMAFFFIEMLGPGLPLEVPAGVVDLDHSRMSRTLTRSLDAMELVDVKSYPMSYHEAMEEVRKGEILGFFMIPEGFERDAVGGRNPQLTYYFNLSTYVPGSLMFKAFKTIGVTAAGGLVQTGLTEKGAPETVTGVVIQPLTVYSHPLENPWLNYSYYLSPSFLYGIMELMIFLMTAFAITNEIKDATSPQWLATARGHISTALFGKLLPQTVIFTIIGWGIDSMMFHWLHFPMNGNEFWMILGMPLFVMACQSFAVFVCSILPNPRLSLSVCSLVGILAFSLAAFSFPVDSMYGAIAIFANILPVRWFFMIYIDQALNGWHIYYSRLYFAALLLFPVVAAVTAPLMKRALRNPVYVP